NRLWMLAADELGQLRRIRVADEVEALRTARGGHALDDFLSLLATERSHEHLAGIVRPTRGDEVARDRHVVALFEHLTLGVFADLFELEDLKGQGFDLALLEVLEHFSRDLRSEGDQERRRLLAALHLLTSDELGHWFLVSQSLRLKR